jgi:hypothetical protein
MNKGKIIILVFGLMPLLSCRTIRTESISVKIGTIEYQNVSIETSRYKGVIFPKDYLGILNSAVNKFTPTINNIKDAEHTLKHGIKKIAEPFPRQSLTCPIISRKLRKYNRQYFGYIDQKGDSIILINCLWNRKGFYDLFEGRTFKQRDLERWKKEEIIVLDGCSYYWTIRVNISKKKLFDLNINGLG